MKIHIGNEEGDWNDHAYARRMHDAQREQYIRQLKEANAKHGECLQVKGNELEYLEMLEQAIDAARYKEKLL